MQDECVTVKSPSKNILVENVYCNWSGGCAMGSLGQDVNVSDITYRNIYTVQSNQMVSSDDTVRFFAIQEADLGSLQYMIKSNGGSGSVSNVVLENFIGHSNAYSMNIEQYWTSMDELAGDGVQLSNIKINNWTGTATDGMQRGPLQIKCADGAPCTGVDVTDFDMWTEKGDSQTYICRSAYTDLKRATPLYCMNGGSSDTKYSATTTTVTSAPTGYEAPKLGDDLKEDFGFTVSIPIPAMPTSFFPGQAPIKALAGGS